MTEFSVLMAALCCLVVNVLFLGSKRDVDDFKISPTECENLLTTFYQCNVAVPLDTKSHVHCHDTDEQQRTT